jgi:hypothetical protein
MASSPPSSSSRIRAISYWLPMLPGAIEYFRLRATVASWRATRRAGADAVTV